MLAIDLDKRANAKELVNLIESSNLEEEMDQYSKNVNHKLLNTF